MSLCVCNEMSPCHKPHSDQLELEKICPGKLAGEKMVWWEGGPFSFLSWSSAGQFRTPVILSRLIDSDIEASYKCFAKMIEMFFPSPLVVILIFTILKETPHSIWRCHLGRQARLFVVQQCCYCCLKHARRPEYVNIYPKYSVASYHAFTFASKNRIRLLFSVISV